MRWIFVLVSALLFTGCSTFTSPSRVHDIDISQTKGYWFDYDATRRGAIMVVQTESQTGATAAGERRLRICAEPSPDVAQTFATKAKANYKQNQMMEASGEGELATQIVKLAESSQMSLFLREALFRLCELTMNSSLTGADVAQMYGRIIDVALRLGSEKALDRDIQELQVGIEKARKEEAALEAQKAEIDKEKKRLEAEIAKNQSEETRKQYEEQLKIVQSALDKKEAELEGASRKLAEARGSITTLERNLAAATTALGELREAANRESETTPPAVALPTSDTGVQPAVGEAPAANSSSDSPTPGETGAGGRQAPPNDHTQ